MNYRHKDFAFDAQLYLQNSDEPLSWLQTDFRNLSERFEASRLPQFEPCKAICRSVLATAEPSRKQLRSALIGILTELYRIDPNKTLKQLPRSVAAIVVPEANSKNFVDRPY